MSKNTEQQSAAHSDLSKKVLEAIQQEKVKPRPKWQFFVLSVLIWISFTTFIILGAFSFMLAMTAIFDQDWIFQIPPHAPRFPIIQSILLSVPYFWLIFLIVFIILGLTLFKKTKKGYRHSFFLVILLTLGLSFMLGSFGYLTDFGPRLQSALISHSPFYCRLVPTREKQWSRPDIGFLAGKIQEIDIDNDLVTIEDLTGKTWQLRFQEETQVQGKVVLEEGALIKIIGQASSPDIFEVWAIKPWHPSHSPSPMGPPVPPCL